MDYYDITGGYAAPVMKPDEVRGLAGHASVQADRFFYLLDESTDRIYEVDGYLKTDVPTGEQYWELLIMCPKCSNVLKLDSRRKSIQVTETGIETGEPMRCTWPVDHDGWKGRCPWACEWKPVKSKEPLIIPMSDAMSGKPGMCKIDALIKPA